MNELDFLRHLLHKLEECGLEDTYLKDIIKCRRILEERINVVKNGLKRKTPDHKPRVY